MQSVIVVPLFSILSKEIDALTVLANEYDNNSLVLKMKRIVPELISWTEEDAKNYDDHIAKGLIFYEKLFPKCGV
mgnify:CR=1 FL=1